MTCEDGKPPRCPSNTAESGLPPTCEDGKAPKCSQGTDAPKCGRRVGPFAQSQLGAGTNFAGPGMCGRMRQLVKNAQAAEENGPPPPWTDMTFVNAYIAAFCPPA